MRLGGIASAHRYATLDGLRGLAALAVAERHCGTWFGGRLESAFLAVDFFFILSGFALAYAYDERLRSGLSARQFLLLRIARLYPLYLIAMTISLGTLYYHTGEIGLRRLTATALILPAWWAKGGQWLGAASWTLTFELLGNCIFATGHRFLTLKALALICFAGLGLLIYSAASFGTLHVGWRMDTLLGGAARMMFGFFLGVLLYRLHVDLPHAARWTIPACIVLLLVLSGHPAQWLRPWYDVSMVVLVLPVIVVVAASTAPSPKIAATMLFLGAISYGFYILHYSLFGAAQTMAHIAHYRIGPWLGAAILLALAIAVYLLDNYYDLPIRRRLNGLILRRSAVQRASLLQ
jgi:peptidoglycan/LPS O-acetylase OafA/YrhL